MKKFYFFALVAAGLLCATNLMAANSVWVLGKEYTADNNDILGDGGSVKYVESTNSLYLTNATLKPLSKSDFYNFYNDGCIIASISSSDFHIYLEGDNTIEYTNDDNTIVYITAILNHKGNVTFHNNKPNPSLSVLLDDMVNSDPACKAIENDGTSKEITFDNCGKITLKCRNNFNSMLFSVGKITFNNVDFDLQNLETDDSKIEGNIWASAEPTYTDCTLMTEGVHWNSNQYQNDGGYPATELQIRRNKAIAFGDMKSISPKDTLLGSETTDAKITSGTVTYSPALNTLTLDNVVCSGGLKVEEAGLTIKVIGTCSVAELLTIGAETTISGNGTFEAKKGVSVGGKLTVKDLTLLTAKNSSGPALKGTGINSDVHFVNSSASLSGSTKVTEALAGLDMQDCFVLTPENAEYSDSKKNFVVGTTDQKEVYIQAGKVYGFTITADGQVTKVHSANADEIPFKGYDKDKKSEKGYISVSGKTLTLHRISKDYKVIVTNTSEEGLTIVSDGESNIQRIVAQINTTIGSGSRLMIEGSNANGLIELNEAAPDPDKDKVKGVTLRFNEANVELKYTGSNRAIYAHHASSTESKERNKIEIYDSDIKVTTDPEKPVLEGLYLWEMDRASFSKPSGAKFSKDDRSIVDKDGQKAVELVIEGGEDLDISIAGDPINSREADKYGFNEATHTLTLEKAKYKGGTDPAISSDYDDLTIVVIGDNTLESKSNNVIEVPSNSTLVIKSGAKSGDDMPTLSLSTGGGKNAKGALWINGKGKVTIDGVELEATNDEGAGIASKGAATLTIKGANVTAQGTDGSISGWASLVLEGSSIVEPDGAYFKEGEGIGMDDAEGKFAVTTEKVVIRATADAIEDIIADTDSSDSSARKVLINGSIFILRDSKMFNTMGQEVQ